MTEAEEHRVEPTQAARSIIKTMRETLTGYDSGLMTLVRQVRGEAGVVTIGCLPSLAASYLPEIILRFSSKQPAVQLDIRDGLFGEVITGVRTGDVDFGIAPLTSRHPDLVQQRLSSDIFYLAVPAEHRFAGDVVPWAALDGQVFISFGDDSSINAPVEEALNSAGAVPGSVMQANNPGTVAGLIASGLGISAVPGTVTSLMDFADLRYLPLVPIVERDICVIRRQGAGISAAAELFIEEMVNT